MKHFKLFVTLIIILLSLSVHNSACAQNLSQNLSNTNVDDLTDSQVKQLMSQGQAAGLSDRQVVQTAQSRGMSAAQAQKLQARISSIRGMEGRNSSASDTVNSSGRNLNYQPENVNNHNAATVAELPIFGADLFRNSNISFEPNLKLATPVNYVLGPGDQLNINVYGQSLVNWKLTVSPEGNINMPSGGILNVAGKTIEQATRDIQGRLIAKNYAIGRGSNLKVTLGDIRSIKVIIAGEVVKPGTFTLPSLATAFNALYSAGGPNDNGTFRQIEIIRNNRIIRHLDVYDFLVKGDQKDNIALQDQDIIRVPSYLTRVELRGAVKNPAIFEVLPRETLQDVIRFAGGFTSDAYTDRIQVSQISDQQRRITDIYKKDYSTYMPSAGDKFSVQKILDRYENRVTINGAVFRPGEYQLQDGLTLLQLINNAGGLKEDAFAGRGTITRLKPDNSTELISFNVADVINKTASYVLQREDVITLYSKFDLHDQYQVAISGEVRHPGSFAYADSMKVENLILMAGGFSEGASTRRIEVARRINNSDPTSKSSTVANVFSVDVNDQLSPDQTNFTLQPYDIVLVYSLPGYQKQKVVNVEGEVLYPGPYIIGRKNEKISDIIKRAGGLTVTADAEGSTLKRNYVAMLGVDKDKVDTAALAREHLQHVNQLKQSFRDTSASQEQLRNNFIGINLVEILKKPGSSTDLLLKDGDVIRIPQQQQVVQVSGEVHLPSGVVYTSGKTFKDYIINAGGYADDALKRGAYVVYPNGTVKGTRKFLFFNNHPEVRPGSEIFVPRRIIRHGGLTIAEIIGLISALGTTAILGILSFKK